MSAMVKHLANLLLLPKAQCSRYPSALARWGAPCRGEAVTHQSRAEVTLLSPQPLGLRFESVYGQMGGYKTHLDCYIMKFTLNSALFGAIFCSFMGENAKFAVVALCHSLRLCLGVA